MHASGRTVAPVTWTVRAPDPADGPTAGPDRPLLEGYLGWQRSTLLAVCDGLRADQLVQRPLPSSRLSLLGLVRHLTKVERTWLRIRAAGEDVQPVFDPALGKDHDFEHLVAADAAGAVERLQQEWGAGDRAVAGMGFDEVYDVGGESWSLRMTYVHLVGEYARHNGHADLLREALDGVRGR
jgi:uncharacterized damage-inducible protein DinB